MREVRDVLVLICGHGGRDERCGIAGPVLKGEFEGVLGRAGLEVLRDAVEMAEGLEVRGKGVDVVRTARVGLISHVGGHKFAGNVIVYVPPGAKTEEGEESRLAGCGIWYGRVEPRHVEGLVRETVLGGRIVEELFRGGVRKGGEILML